MSSNISLSTDSGLSAEMKAYYERMMIEVLRPRLVHSEYAQSGRKIMVPGGTGKVCEMRKRVSFPIAGELTEGVTPVGQKLSVTKLEIPMKQFGDFTTVSDVLSLTAYDDVLGMAAENLGEQAADTIDDDVKEALNSGTNIQRVNNRATIDAITSSDKLSGSEVLKGIRTLRRNKARPAVNGLYVGLVHVDVEHDLMQDADFKSATRSNTMDPQGRFENAVLGVAWGVLWLSSTVTEVYAAAGSGGVDVYSTLLLGADALGLPEWQSIEFIYHGLGSAGSADPVNQRQTAAWKLANGSKIVQEAHVLQIQSAAST